MTLMDCSGTWYFDLPLSAPSSTYMAGGTDFERPRTMPMGKDIAQTNV
jgi:hypothetical protein